MSETDDGRFAHDSKAQILKPSDVEAAAEKITSHAGDKPEAIRFATWSESNKAAKK